MYAFGIWLTASVLFAGIGLTAWNAKKAVRFWSITQQIQVRDVRKYNRAVAKMWFVFAGLFAVAGLPLLGGQNSPWIICSILGSMFLSIGMMFFFLMIEILLRVYG